MNSLFSKIGEIGIIPVVVLENTDDAYPLGMALTKGGLACAEITFRTNAAAESIRIMSRHFPDMLIGAGTVLTTEQVDCAVASGARFIVSPGLNPRVVKHCIDIGIPVIPGCANPSDIEQALELGLDVVKFFPAEAAGGLKYIKAVSAPYTQVSFMPTGGITPDNVSDYLAFPRILACGGSWMVKDTLIREGSFEKIEQLTREAAKLVSDVRGSKS